jgi:hypothetical protein
VKARHETFFPEGSVSDSEDGRAETKWYRTEIKPAGQDKVQPDVIVSMMNCADVIGMVAEPRQPAASNVCIPGPL